MSPADASARAQLLAAARAQVRASLDALAAQLQQIGDDQAGDTKSSAGDKFETAREMLQQELDRLGAQARTAREQLLQLSVAERAPRGEQADLGSAVTLANGERYLLGCGLGRLRDLVGPRAYAVSLESPVGRELRGLRVGDRFRGERIARLD